MYLTGWGVDACLPCSSSLSLGNQILLTCLAVTHCRSETTRGTYHTYASFRAVPLCRSETTRGTYHTYASFRAVPLCRSETTRVNGYINTAAQIFFALLFILNPYCEFYNTGFLPSTSSMVRKFTLPRLSFRMPASIFTRSPTITINILSDTTN